MVFSEKDVQCLSAGAHILGGGGGGQKSRGLKTAEDALQIGTVRMVDAADLCDGDILVTVSGVGAPSKKEAMYLTSHYLCALDLLEQQMDLPIAGFIPSEMGASAAFGPFIAAAAKGLPIIDAACDGRAHPLGNGRPEPCPSQLSEEPRCYRLLYDGYGIGPHSPLCLVPLGKSSRGGTIS